MSKRTVYTVTYDKGAEQWKGQEVGNKKASAKGETKQEVVERMSKIARDDGNSQLRIYYKDKKGMQEERTYGNDPYPPKG